MTFGEPIFLQIGAGLVLLVLLGFWSHARRKRRLAAFFGGKRGAGRVSRYSLYRFPFERVLLLVPAVAAAALAAADPRWVAPPVAPPPPPIIRHIVVALDVSASMQATDVAPNRLARGTEIVRQLMEEWEGERVGLLLFAGESYPIAPPTTDHAALGYLLSGVTPTIASAHDPGSLPSSGITGATRLFEDPAEWEAAGERLIVLISDGEGGEPDAATLAAARAAENERITIHTIGVGTTTGSTMVMPEAPFQLRAQILDESGAPAFSRLRPSALQRISELTGGSYIPASDDAAVREFVRTFEEPVLPPEPPSTPPLWARYDLVYLLLAGSLGLLLLESLLDVRLPRRAPRPYRKAVSS
jgi:Ca-activated chloride channel family protein